MEPLIIYALFAAGMGFSIHKRKWGLAAFFGAMCLWMVVIQVIQVAIALLAAHSGFAV